jgi:hypothetical protein
VKEPSELIVTAKRYLLRPPHLSLADFPPLTSKITMPPIRLEGAKTMAVPAHGAHSKNIEQYDHSMIERHGKAPSHNPDLGELK